MKRISLAVLFMFSGLAFAQDDAQKKTEAPTEKVEAKKADVKADAKKESKKDAKADKNKGKKMFAVLETSKGTVKVQLFPDKAPKAVENFVGLAEGTKEWTDPKTGKKQKKALYDGTPFHRIIKGFMIQGGDPLGTGTGGPGYQFDNEKSDLKHDKPGILAMANAGPNTNGSQFYITVAKAAWLDGGYTIFGEVVDGMDVVMKISEVKTGAGDKPVEPIILKHVKIEQK